MENYTMRTFEEQFKICYNQLADLGHKAELAKKQYQLQFIDSLRTLGKCRNHGDNKYTIYLNKNHANISDAYYIMTTIMHELIHSLDRCMSHTGRWKEIAAKASAKYGYNIVRVESTDEAYSNYYHETKLSRMRYEVVCCSCNAKTLYQRKGKVVDDIMNSRGKYYCNHCGATNKFVVKELT